MYKAAIFDLDGTLLDTLEDLAAAGNHSLAAYGLPGHAVLAYKRFIGNGMYNLVRRSLPAEKREDTALIHRVFASTVEYYNRHSMDHTHPYEGILPLLQRLHDGGTKVGVLTNKPHANAQVLVERLFPGVVDLVQGQREGIPIKPDPMVLHEMLQIFHTRPDGCIYIGDSVVDIETGRNAGIFTVGVSWGYATKNDLKTAMASVIVDEVEDLTALLIDNR